MSIEKIGVNNTPLVAESVKTTNFKGTTVGDVPNDDKSKAIKYMLGATALAAIVAAGVIGHKNNWWKTAKKVEGAIGEEAGKAKDELKKLEEAVKNKKEALEKAEKEANTDAINKAKEELQNAEKALEEAKNKSAEIKPKEVKPEEAKTAETKPEEVKPEEVKPEEVKPAETKPEEVKPEEVKPEEVKPAETKPEEVKPEEVKPAETKPEEVKPEEVKPAETKPEEIKPEEAKPTEMKPEEVKTATEEATTKATEGIEEWLKPFEELDCSDFSKVKGISWDSDTVVIKNSKGVIIRSFKKGEDGSVKLINDFDPITGHPTKTIWTRENGKGIRAILEYDKNGHNLKDTYYDANEKITSIVEYDVEGLKWKQTSFNEDNTIYSIIETKPDESQIEKCFYNDGKINYYNECFTDRTSTSTLYDRDGKTLWTKYYDKDHNMQKQIIFDNERQVSEYDKDYKLVKKTNYDEDGKTILSVTDMKDGKEHITHYRKNGKVRFEEFENKNGDIVRKQSLRSRIQDLFEKK